MKENILKINTVALLLSILWVVFEPGFEPVIVSFTLVSTLIGLKFSTRNQDDVNIQNINKNLPQSEVSKISERFRKLLKLMNGKQSYNIFTISKLAKILNLKKVGKLENIFLGESEPTFKFIEKFCKEFGINKKWLLHGQGQPYSRVLKTHHTYAEDYLELLLSQNIHSIYFVRNNSDKGEALIIIEFEEWKYVTIPSIWHISSHIGGTGYKQIYSFYKLIKSLQSQVALKCRGRILEKNDFSKLATGSLFAGVVMNTFTESHWWDDFTDIHYKYFTVSKYKALYGEEFIYAQSVVKEQLS